MEEINKSINQSIIRIHHDARSSVCQTQKPWPFSPTHSDCSNWGTPVPDSSAIL